jgi:hypothetical protein
MRSFSLRAAGVLAALFLAAPLSAHAANPVVKLKVAGSSKLLTYNPTLGFANLQAVAGAVPNQQRWEKIKGPGPTVFYRNVANNQCLRASATNNVSVRTVTCDLTDSAESRRQQWILSGTGQLANRARLLAQNPADSLTADFTNVNRVVGMAKFTGASNQKWSQLAG